MAERQVSAEARRIVANSLVWDNHTCLPLRPDDYGFFHELETVAKSGVDVISVNVGFGPVSLDEHLAMIDGFTDWVANHQDFCVLVRSAADIEDARAQGRLAVFLDVEGMAPLDGDRIDLIEPWRIAGVGWMLVAYNKGNDAGAGCTDPEDGGLTAHGRRLIDEMKRVGMMVCCSHTGHRTAREVMEYHGGPVIFSHSNASAVFDHYRNIPDDLIRDCAQTGGVIGINGIGAFLGDGPASVSRLVDHIEHVASIAGTDHVGLGLDYVYDRQELVDFLQAMPDMFPHESSNSIAVAMIGPTRIGEIVDQLLGRGISPDDVKKILGQNWMRVARAAWH